MRKRKLFRISAWTLAILFVLMNGVAFLHAYKFTHFAAPGIKKTKEPGKLSTGQKIATLFLGVNNPRPVNEGPAPAGFETIFIRSNKRIECWLRRTAPSKGTVILFHGYGGHKSRMLDKAAVFRQLGYNTLLVDFMGSGGSDGNQTTIGYLEAEQVKSCFDFLTQQGEQHICLFGTSMGAVAIMKAVRDHQIRPQGIIIECPFGSMYQTVCARFNTMHAPTFPMAGLLVFWGGLQNGFWAFGHNPAVYAEGISCPVLLLYGAQDQNVCRQEIDEIFNHLKGKKELRIYPRAGHENYLKKYRAAWTADVSGFLEQH